MFYQNIRQTADVAVKKNLTGNTSFGTFVYTASYTLGERITDLGAFNVTSNSETGYILEGIPVGAVLTISEAENSSYEVSTAFEKGSADTNAADNTVSFTVPNGGETVTYTNALKSFPVKIQKVDQAGNGGVEARFDLSQDGANIVSGKYTTPTDNTIFDGNLYVGEYTLTETWTQAGYLGLSRPVGLKLSGDGTLESDNSGAVVTGDADNGFIVTITNQATTEVTVKKVLDDPLINQRTFTFTAAYELGGVTQALPAFSILSSKTTPGSHVLTVPVGANLTVTEDTTGLDNIYETTVSNNGSESAADSEIVIGNVQEASEIVFTNTRKTAIITVVKEMSDPMDHTSFKFTAALKNGSNPLPDYLVYTTPGLFGFNKEEHRTDSAGEVTYELSHGQSQAMTIPVGTVLSIREDAGEFIAQTTSASGTEDADTEDNQFTFTVSGDDTITFANAPKGLPVILKKIGYNNTDESIWDLEGVTFKIYTDINKSAESLVTLDGKSEFTSNEQGLLYEGMIPTGTYYLDETNTPAGYNSTPGMYVLTVTNTGVTLNCTETIGTPDLNDWITSETDNVTGVTTYTIAIRNTTGYELPSTGGPGTRPIYILGVLLTGLAGIGLVMRKRRKTT